MRPFILTILLGISVLFSIPATSQELEIAADYTDMQAQSPTKEEVMYGILLF